MFNWVKRLFKKEEPEMLYAKVMFYTGTIQEGRSKGGQFAKGNKAWANTNRDKKGRFKK